MSASSSMFRGTRALLADRRGVFVHVPLWGGLLPAFLLGLMCALARAGAPNVLREIGLPSFAAACGCIPLMVALPWTVVSQVNTPVRRDELLALPLGRLALPTAALLGSLLAIAAWLVAALLGLTVTVGLRALVDGLLDPTVADTVRMWLGAAVAAFAIGISVGSIGSSWALAVGAWGIAPLVVLSAARGMGYTAEAQRTYAVLCTAGVSLYLLVLPFVLYARPLHIWTSSRQPEVEGSWLLALFTAVGATITLGLAGVGWTLAGGLAVGGGLTWLTRRGRPALRGESALRLALLTSIAPVAPLVGLAVAVDARADVEHADALVPIEVQASPDGRHVAFAVEPRAALEGGVCPRTRRVVVIDLTGERAPIFVPSRFAELTSSAWSSDGRYLAVEDHAIGRLHSEPSRPAWKLEVVVDPFDVIGFKVGTAFNEGWIVDTHTGELEVVDAFELAPGWTTPDDLVTCSSSLSGEHVLRDGAGRELVLPRARGAVRVIGYTSAGPLLAVGPQTPAVIDPAFGPVAANLLRWDATGALVEHEPGRGARWAEEMQAVRDDGVVSLRTLTRDGAELVLDPDVSRVFLDACDADAVVAIAGDALVRIRVKDGARTVLVPVDAAGAAPAVRVVDPASCRALVVRGDAVTLVDLKTGASTPLPSAAKDALALVGDAAFVPSVGDWPVLLTADGATRPVRP